MKQSHTVSDWLPCPVVFISTAYGERRDIMTATAMFISEKEPLLAISVARDHLTAQLIEQAGGFTLVIVSEGQKELAWQLGSVKGEEEDKFKHFSITTLPPKEGKPLIPEDASSWLECRAESRQEVNGYFLVIARVVDQEDLGKPPLLWQKQSLFALKAL
jgi:flavin reductase (DIM6/NTAB) family NADH-FMN oxidoreductase RutF